MLERLDCTNNYNKMWASVEFISTFIMEKVYFVYWGFFFLKLVTQNILYDNLSLHVCDTLPIALPTSLENKPHDVMS